MELRIFLSYLLEQLEESVTTENHLIFVQIIECINKALQKADLEELSLKEIHSKDDDYEDDLPF